MTTEMLEACKEESANGEKRIREHYERQLTIVNDLTVEAQRILIEEQ